MKATTTPTTTNQEQELQRLKETAWDHGLTAYLRNSAQPTVFTTTKDIEKASSNHRDISCLVASVTIPKGTTGLLYQHNDYRYSEYGWIGDMQVPKIGATRTLIGRSYTFICFLPDGRFASKFITVL